MKSLQKKLPVLIVAILKNTANHFEQRYLKMGDLLGRTINTLQGSGFGLDQ